MKKNKFQMFALPILFTVLLTGCGEKKGWNLITTKDGLVYRINQQTGEVSLISGSEAIKVEDVEVSDARKGISSTAVYLPIKKPYSDSYIWTNKNEDVSDIYNLPIATYGMTNVPSPGKPLFRTKWRTGVLYYNLRIAQGDVLDKILTNTPNAQIGLSIQLYDKDCFPVLNIPLTVSEMNRVLDHGYKSDLDVGGGLTCTLNAFTNIKTWNYTLIQQ